jgi:hypothetical protein
LPFQTTISSHPLYLAWRVSAAAYLTHSAYLTTSGGGSYGSVLSAHGLL